MPQTLAHAASDNADDSSNLTVTVTDGSTPTPTPTPNPSPSASIAGSTGLSGSKGAVGSGVPGDGGSAGTSGPGSAAGVGAGAVSVGGMVYVGGINSSVGLSPDPGQADVTLWMSIGNASTSVIDVAADFWMESVLLGVPLDQTRGIVVSALQPGEVRVVSTRLHNAGQWGAINVHATITPPATVDGTALTPVTRDATVVVFPWLVGLAAAILAIGLLAWRAVVLLLAAKPPLEAAA